LNQNELGFKTEDVNLKHRDLIIGLRDATKQKSQLVRIGIDHSPQKHRRPIADLQHMKATK